ncbi:Ribosomal RNA large subunit methyltransferase H [compost metagenome]
MFCLDLKGKEYSSEEFADKINDISIYDSSTIVFVIGGSLGLNDTLLKNSNSKIKFSKLTFPHQLIRIFLLEQVYRAFKILNNENYHH